MEECQSFDGSFGVGNPLYRAYQIEFQHVSDLDSNGSGQGRALLPQESCIVWRRRQLRRTSGQGDPHFLLSRMMLSLFCRFFEDESTQQAAIVEGIRLIYDAAKKGL